MRSIISTLTVLALAAGGKALGLGVDKVTADAIADIKQDIAKLENLTATITAELDAKKDWLADLKAQKKCALLLGPKAEPCTSIPGGALDVAPARPACCTRSGYALVSGAPVIDDTDRAFCPAGAPRYPGTTPANGTQVVVFTSPAPPPHTCVNITLGGGSCTSIFGLSNYLFMSAWAGDFPLSLSSWPASGRAGAALFRADIGKQCFPATASFIMPPGHCTFSIVLSSTNGPTNCTYGDITVAYQQPPAPTPTPTPPPPPP